MRERFRAWKSGIEWVAFWVWTGTGIGLFFFWLAVLWAIVNIID